MNDPKINSWWKQWETVRDDDSFSILRHASYLQKRYLQNYYQHKDLLGFIVLEYICRFVFSLFFSF